jgi:hypothetical protein
VNATVPVATLVAMVALVAGLLMGLAWRRTHRPAPRVEAELAFGGRPARMVQVIDVSAEVSLQAEREQMIARLQQSREWLATAINAGRIALWERDLLSHSLVMGGAGPTSWAPRRKSSVRSPKRASSSCATPTTCRACPCASRPT